MANIRKYLDRTKHWTEVVSTYAWLKDAIEWNGGKTLIRIGKAYMDEYDELDNWRYWVGKVIVMQVLLYADTGVFLHPTRRKSDRELGYTKETLEMIAYYEEMMKEWTSGFE